MDITDKEKELIIYLVEKELKEFEKQEKEIRPGIALLEQEEKYDEFLKTLLEKIK